MQVLYLLRVLFILDICRYRIHRTRSVQRYPGYDILQAVRSKIFHEPCHAGRFKLEHSFGIARSNQFKYSRIVKIHIVKVYFQSAPLPYQVQRVPYYRYVPEAKKVHLQKPQLFQSILFELCLYNISVAVKRHIVIDRPL